MLKLKINEIEVTTKTKIERIGQLVLLIYALFIYQYVTIVPFYTKC